MIEILAPAGSSECIEPAVRCGADAVYLGASRFSARGSAKNFDADALRETVRYCHARGVKVYLALNILLRDEELSDALALAEYACSLPVDALIVQDLGLAAVLRACAPRLKLNASTQMSLHSPAGVRLAEALGFGRVVLSRELSRTEVEAIRAETEIELEAFVHGALCMSVSGQCYFSAMLGSRSGNRGLCAQTCRLPFHARGGTGSDLSLRDLSLAERIRELEAAGVCSAKIEGRMKRPEYVAAAVSVCAHARDGVPMPEGLTDDLRNVFSRSGFTTGYWDGKLGREMFGKRSKEDAAAADSAVFARLHPLFRAERASVPVQIRFTMKSGVPAVLTLTDSENRRAECIGAIPQTAQNRPLSASDCAERLSKLGGTPFYAASADCAVDEGLMLPASEMNRMRREASEALLRLREAREPIAFDRTKLQDTPAEHTPQARTLRVHFADISQIPPDWDGAEAELVYVPADTPTDALEALQDRGLPLGIELPRGIFGTEAHLRRRLREAKETGIRDVWAGTLGAVALAREEGMIIHGGYGLNVMNTQSLQVLETLGLADAEVSIELTLAQTARLGGELPRGVFVYGRQALMLTRNCPIKNGLESCAQCNKKGELTDRTEAHLPVRCNGGCSEILNAVPTYLLDRMHEIHGADFCFMRFTVENAVEISEILRQYPNGARPNFAFTRGLSEKGVY